MREIVFRPLRRIKKTGQIIVASYPQWRKVMTADYNQFDLIINDEYKLMPEDEFVYNHKGELLYFIDYNPAEVPVYNSDAERIIYENWLEIIHEKREPHGIEWEHGAHINYHMPLADCGGVPTFSHVTAEYVSDYYCNPLGGYPDKIFDFTPLTVRIVKMWFGWFLWQLNNSHLKIGK